MKLGNDQLGRIETWFALLVIIITVAMAVLVTMPWLVAWNIILVVFKINTIVGQWHSAGSMWRLVMTMMSIILMSVWRVQVSIWDWYLLMMALLMVLRV